jgi:hypothetical protein
MDCLKLLTEAQQAGLKVAAEGDQLVIRGPKSAGHIAEALISRKQEIMELLSRQESKPTAVWTADEKQLVAWLNDNYDHLIDRTETFQHQIDIAGLMLVLRRGPAACGSKQAVSDLPILKRNPAEFHAEMERRHERELDQWNPRYRKEK